jgi:hypothetical protein
LANGATSAERLVESLVDVARQRAGIEEATMAAAALPGRTVAVLDAARALVPDLDVDDDTRKEVRRLLDLLGATGLFRR